jgi:hypothetical protein
MNRRQLFFMGTPVIVLNVPQAFGARRRESHYSFLTIRSESARNYADDNLGIMMALREPLLDRVGGRVLGGWGGVQNERDIAISIPSIGRTPRICP